jgi:hypothetical protein
MPETLEIPTVEIGIGGDYLFTASQAIDLLGLIDFSAVAGSSFTVEVYSLVFPTGTVDDTLTGAKVSGSDIDFYAIFTDTLTGAYTDGDERWAKLILNAGTNAQAIAMMKLIFRGK